MPHVSPGPALSYRPVMIFIDGGYLRESLRMKFQDDRMSVEGVQNLIWYLMNLVGYGNVKGELIRTYYYDAIVDENEKEKREEQKLFFDMIRSAPFCTVRLGRLVKTVEGYRQKGVDILMAIDMITKAYENQYDIAILLAGDGDFVDLVEAVKDAGKRIYGAYLVEHVSKDLLEKLDVRVKLTKDVLKGLITT